MHTYYNNLNLDQKKRTDSKIALWSNSSIGEVKKVLSKMNPPITITDGEIALHANTLKRIEKNIRNSPHNCNEH
ncbi:hypothetical protein [Aquimarina macrocephali]|uniref:hypothetical protein n=1 Tax=Aquimarina macrocephali TaxID=666563 RepID=UPI0004676379|nr:hypothetical protein [Aquimarina macrocephali]